MKILFPQPFFADKHTPLGEMNVVLTTSEYKYCKHNNCQPHRGEDIDDVDEDESLPGPVAGLQCSPALASHPSHTAATSSAPPSTTAASSPAPASARKTAPALTTTLQTGPHENRLHFYQ